MDLTYTQAFFSVGLRVKGAGFYVVYSAASKLRQGWGWGPGASLRIFFCLLRIKEKGEKNQANTSP